MRHSLSISAHITFKLTAFVSQQIGRIKSAYLGSSEMKNITTTDPMAAHYADLSKENLNGKRYSSLIPNIFPHK